jgi:hypothetical protein
MYFSPSTWKGLSMVFDVAKDRENSCEPPVEELLVAGAEQPVRTRAAIVGTARAPALRPE